MYHLCAALVPGTFFNATHQVKAIAIGVSEANPLGELVDCCFPQHLHVFFPTKAQNRYKELFPNTPFILALYFQICAIIGITFTRPVFLFKIDHDDGTVTPIMSCAN